MSKLVAIKSAWLILFRIAHNTENIVLIAVVRVVVVTVSNLAVVGIVIPRATPLNTVIARRRTRSPFFAERCRIFLTKFFRLTAHLFFLQLQFFLFAVKSRSQSVTATAVVLRT